MKALSNITLTSSMIYRWYPIALLMVLVVKILMNASSTRLELSEHNIPNGTYLLRVQGEKHLVTSTLLINTLQQHTSRGTSKLVFIASGVAICQ